MLRENLDITPNESTDDARLLGRIQATNDAFGSVLDRGLNHWVLTFSGGKDSTATAVAGLEFALSKARLIRRLDVIYADTGLEIPSIGRFARRFLRAISTSPRLSQLPLHTHIVRPPIRKSYWVLLLGRGYPPPHQRFRWCTTRLKIEPAEAVLRGLIERDRTAILTGVRFGESRARDTRLSASCSRGGECGQGLWLEHSRRLGATYFAPLIDWQDCDVWDYLTLVAPTFGYRTRDLSDLYNGPDTRFGCWTCTVVTQEKALARTVERTEWRHLAPMAVFRQHLWDSTRSAQTRLDKDGRPGRLDLVTRQRLLAELLAVQEETGVRLITKREIAAIHREWQQDEALQERPS